MIVWMAWTALSMGAPEGCGEWVRQPIEGIQEAIRAPQLAIGEDGRIHAVWYAVNTNRTHYGWRAGASWRTTDLGPGRADMVVLGSVPYVAQSSCDADSCVLNYGWKEEDAWTRRDVLSMVGPITTPTLALDSMGLPHIVYGTSVGDASLVMHASPTLGPWHTDKIYSGSTRLGPPDMVADAEGGLHMLFTKSDEGGQILSMTQTKEGWLVERTELGRGREVSLHWGDIGAPYASYFLDGQRVAVRTPKNGWVNYGQPLAGAAVLTVAKGGSPHFLMVVDERPIKRLEWIRWTGRDWQRELVAADPNGFRAFTFTLDRNNCPHILYQHSASRKTVYAHAKL